MLGLRGAALCVATIAAAVLVADPLGLVFALLLFAPATVGALTAAALAWWPAGTTRSTVLAVLMSLGLALSALLGWSYLTDTAPDRTLDGRVAAVAGALLGPAGIALAVTGAVRTARGEPARRAPRLVLGAGAALLVLAATGALVRAATSLLPPD